VADIYELLDAVNLKDVRTTAEVAERLSVEKDDARKQLRAAERQGLVHEDVDESLNTCSRRRGRGRGHGQIFMSRR
jgi:predicted ArsR family transcriptional regulator